MLTVGFPGVLATMVEDWPYQHLVSYAFDASLLQSIDEAALRDTSSHALVLRTPTLAGLMNNAGVAIFSIRVSRSSLILEYRLKPEYVPANRCYG